MIASATQSFHLFYEALDSQRSNGSPSSPTPHARLRPRLELPHQPVHLALRADGPPSIAALGVAAPAGSLVLEPVYSRQHQLRLVMLKPPGLELTLNGERAPLVAVLKERDQFQLGHAFNFHVAVLHQPRIGPPPAEVIGKPCPVCLVAFAAEARCYVCPCGRVLHLEGEPHEENKLQCARVHTECPGCHRPIVLTEGFSGLPAFES